MEDWKTFTLGFMKFFALVFSLSLAIVLVIGEFSSSNIFVLALFGGGTLLFGVIHLFQNFIARK